MSITLEDYNKLMDQVLALGIHIPEALFRGGFDNWHCRARLGHYLAMPELKQPIKARDLFLSVLEAEPDENNSEDVEEKLYALQHLSEVEKSLKNYKDALEHINSAIMLAEDTDYLYQYILRGELWAERWNILHLMKRTQEAEEEADERIEVFKDIPVEHNSYLYYGYRFKAQLAAERGVKLVAKDYMYMALHSMEIPKDYQPGIDKAMSATHDNISWILAEVDRATPNPDKLHWDI